MPDVRGDLINRAMAPPDGSGLSTPEYSAAAASPSVGGTARSPHGAGRR
jgi:hypothetical protein